MLVRFFTNSSATAHLRGLAEEFGESTNAVRLELNNLSKAGYLISKPEGRTIKYSVNTTHPLYLEVRNLVHKYLGLDKIVDTVLRRLGELKYAFIVGDYAVGKDSGKILLVLVGKINKVYLDRLLQKAENLLRRKIQAEVVSEEEFDLRKGSMDGALLIWGKLQNEKSKTIKSFVHG